MGVRVSKGVQFEDSDAADGLGLVPAQPIVCLADLPDGTVDASGLEPNVVPTSFRIFVPEIRAKNKPPLFNSTGRIVEHRTFFAPICIPRDADGKWPRWAARNVQNNDRRQQMRDGKARMREREDGEASSGGESQASSQRSVRARFGGYLRHVGAPSSFTGKPQRGFY